VYTDDVTTNGYLIGGGKILIEMDVQIPTLSDGTNTFRWFGGFSTSNSAPSVTSIAFLYDASGTSGGSAATPNWQVVCANASVRSYTTTAIAVTAGQWYRLKLIVNAAGTSVDFYIDGTLVKTETTNIPSTATQLPLACIAVKTAGTTERNVWVDFFRIKQKFTNQR
jgi:hypothetical protein